MKTHHIIRFVFGLFLITLANGCATKALWNNGRLEAWNQPAANPHLRLFEAKPSGDLLVVYDEYSERHNANHTRAYWLNENQKIIDDGRIPHFVSTNTTFSLTAIPVLISPPAEINSPLKHYAVVSAERRSFTLYSGATQINSHELPFYNDGTGKVEKLALTPLATTADLAIVGCFIGYMYLAARGGTIGSWWF